MLTFFISKPRQQRDIRRLQIHFEHNLRKFFHKNTPFLSKVSKNFFKSGVTIDFAYIKAEGLDIYGANIQEILEKAKKDIDQNL